MLNVFLLILASYLTGSIPTAILAGKILKKIDIRDHGSGNAGATNVFRVLGWKAGLVVLLIDILKGFIVVQWFIEIIDYNIETLIYFQLIAGIAAISGHIWTIFAGFKGGKGVGTAAGVCLGLQPFAVFICILVFIGVVARTGYVSLGSMIAAILLPVLLSIQKFILNIYIPVPMLILSIALALLILITHRANINRLIEGTENKISLGKKEGK